jgi:protocatechuate 3,4-dioxygenase beta subunit
MSASHFRFGTPIRLSLLTALWLCLATFGVSNHAQAEDGNAVIEGRVTDAITTAPVAGARVYYSRWHSSIDDVPTTPEMENAADPFFPPDHQPQFVETNAEGEYRIGELIGGKYLLHARADDYYTTARRVEVEAGHAIEVNFELQPIPEDQAGSINGFVHDAATSEPIAGAWVYFAPIPPDDSPHALHEIELWLGVVRTGENGFYQSPRLRPGEYVVLARARHYQPQRMAATVEAGQDTQVDFLLDQIPPPPPGSIAGTVRDAATMEPIAGAWVFHHPRNNENPGSSDGDYEDLTTETLSGLPHARTDEEGHYVIEPLAPGKYRLHVRAAGYHPAHESAEVEPGEVTEVNFKLKPLENDEPGAIEGTVRDRETGEPIAGARVYYGDADDDHGDHNVPEWSIQPEDDTPFVVTDEEGHYRIGPLRPDEYHLLARAEGYRPAHKEARVHSGETVEVNFALLPDGPVEPGVVEGRVVDGMTGDPIAGAKVFYGPRFDDDHGPEWWEDEQEREHHGDNSGSGDDDDHEAQPGPTPTLTLPFVLTDENGNYRIGDLRPGEWHLLVKADGYSSAHRRVEVESGRVTVANFELRPDTPPLPGAIEGFVRDAATSEPLAGARIYYRHVPSDDPVELEHEIHHSDDHPSVSAAATTPPFVLTDEVGHYRIDGLRPGYYHLLATAEGYRPRARRAEVESGEATRVNFRLWPITDAVGSVFGRAIDARTEAPLAGADVWVVPDGDVVILGVVPAIIHGQAVTDDEGNYRIEGVPAGPVRVFASKQFYRAARKAAEVPADGEVEVDFALQPTPGAYSGHLKGTVLDSATEEPIRRAFVILLPEDVAGFELSRRCNVPRVTLTDRNGQYGFRHIPAGLYRVVAVKIGYSVGEQLVPIVAGEIAEANFLLDPIGPPPTGSLAGLVLDAETSEPLVNALVHINVDPATDLVSRKRWTVRTNEDGLYRIAGIPVGEYRTTAFKRGYEPLTRAATIVENETTRLDFRLAPVVQFGGLEGVVTDALTSEPIAHALVYIPLFPDRHSADANTALFARTDNTGHYRIGGVPAGQHIVIARHRGYFPDAQLATVDADTTTTLDFELIPWPPSEGRHLRIRAINARTGKPIANARIHVPIDDWTAPLGDWDDHGVTTDQNGWCELDDVPPGDWPLVGAADGFDPQALLLDPAGETAPASGGISLTAADPATEIVLEFEPATVNNAAADWLQYP